jgi:rod shape-determining protein MreB
MANSMLGRDMAVDLGTANTLVYVRGRGVVLNEPSVVATRTDEPREAVAFGHEAKKMIGRTPGNITAIRPLKDGVIADFDAAEQMLRYFIQRVHRRRYFAKPRIVVCVPSGITAVEQRAVRDAGYMAGARKVYIIEEPMAAALGSNLEVRDATGNMVIRVAGDAIDKAVVNYCKKEYSLLLGEATSEQIKMTIGSAFPTTDGPDSEIRGRDMVSGLPRTVKVSSSNIRQAIEEPITAIVDAVKATLDKTPPELAGDIVDRGIVLTGGGALLKGMDERLRHETGIPIHVADNPLDAVVLGAGKCVDNIETLNRILVTDNRR